MNNQPQQNELLHRSLAQEQNNLSIHQSVQPNNTSQLFTLQSPLQKQSNMNNQSVTQSLAYGAVPKLNTSSVQARNMSYLTQPQGAVNSNNFELWSSPQQTANFCIYEQSMQEIQNHVPPKGK